MTLTTKRIFLPLLILTLCLLQACSGDESEQTMDDLDDAASDAARATEETASDLKDSAARTAENVKEGATEAAGKIKDATAEAGERLQDACEELREDDC